MGKRKKKSVLQQKSLEKVLSADKQKQRLAGRMKDILCSQTTAFSKEEITLNQTASDGTGWLLSCKEMDLYLCWNPFQIPAPFHNGQPDEIETLLESMIPVLNQARSLLEGTALVSSGTLEMALIPVMLAWAEAHPILPPHPKASFSAHLFEHTLYGTLYLKDGGRMVSWQDYQLNKVIQQWDVLPIADPDASIPHLLQCQQVWKQQMDIHPGWPLLADRSVSCVLPVSADPLPLCDAFPTLPDCPSLRCVLEDIQGFHHWYFQRFQSLSKQPPDPIRQILLNRTVCIPAETLHAQLVCKDGVLEAQAHTSLLSVQARDGKVVHACIDPHAQNGPLPLPFPLDCLEEVHSFLMESLPAEDQTLIKKGKGIGLLRGKTTLVLQDPKLDSTRKEFLLLASPCPSEPAFRSKWCQKILEQLQQVLETFKKDKKQADDQLLQALKTIVTTTAQMDLLKEMENIGSCSLSAICKIMAGSPYRGTFWGNEQLKGRYAGIFSEEDLRQQASTLETAGLVEIKTRSYHGASYPAICKTKRGLQALHLMQCSGYQPAAGTGHPVDGMTGAKKSPAPAPSSNPPIYTPVTRFPSQPISSRERCQLAALLDPSASGHALDREECWLLIRALTNTQLKSLHGPAILDLLHHVPEPLFSWVRLLLMALPDPILLPPATA